MKNGIPRGTALSAIAGLTLIAATGTATLAADDSGGTKAQYKYQDKPGAGGKKCSGCTFFKAPAACQLVKGKISPKGYCVAFAAKAK